MSSRPYVLKEILIVTTRLLFYSSFVTVGVEKGWDQRYYNAGILAIVIEAFAAFDWFCLSIGFNLLGD